MSKESNDAMVRLIREFGYLRVQRAANYAVTWGYVRSKLGHDPTDVEIKEYLVMGSGRSLDRQAKAFREVTGERSPAPLLARAGIDLDEAQPSELENVGIGLLPYLAG